MKMKEQTQQRLVMGESFKIWWDNKEQIVRARAFGLLDEEAAEGIREETARMAEEYGDGLDWLIDLSQMTKVTAQARAILAEASGHPSIHKYTFAGASIFIRTVANFIAAAAGQKNARHFSSEEEALRWLREEE
jgi:hypothetical protein